MRNESWEGEMRSESWERKRSPSGNPAVGMVASRVRRHINKLGSDAIFVTRDVLYCGKRAAVDSVLYRLVRSGDLIRLARGVFTSSRLAKQIPSAFEIVKAKAAAFKRAIFRHSLDAAVELGLSATGNPDMVFATDGANSSFFIHAYGKRVELKNVCPRKRDDNDSEVLRAIRAVWVTCRGSSCLGDTSRRSVAHRLGRQAWDQFLTSFQIMPAWLWDNVQKEAERAMFRLRK